MRDCYKNKATLERVELLKIVTDKSIVHYLDNRNHKKSMPLSVFNQLFDYDVRNL